MIFLRYEMMISQYEMMISRYETIIGNFKHFLQFSVILANLALFVKIGNLAIFGQILT